MRAPSRSCIDRVAAVSGNRVICGQRTNLPYVLLALLQGRPDTEDTLVSTSRIDASLLTAMAPKRVITMLVSRRSLQSVRWLHHSLVRTFGPRSGDSRLAVSAAGMSARGATR